MISWLRRLVGLNRATASAFHEGPIVARAQLSADDLADLLDFTEYRADSPLPRVRPRVGSRTVRLGVTMTYSGEAIIPRSFGNNELPLLHPGRWASDAALG